MSKRASFERVQEAIFEGSVGFCLACGAEAYGVEPDACEYPCEERGHTPLYGAEELLITREYDI